ncbi:50S ribosomal protein L1 [Rubricoccus marinus]|uniref:Large ribosomal subunit protein uL1 n=1 Tax=Rubricoccus marinus TaxID=716817 RepID=A0A259TWZ8_9BACT|nr:50S ribosomal protein L1 [Rubricoccus marinus]OZC02285.1 50S ribosomal protein L1 [Rubricoccus marinus]
MAKKGKRYTQAAELIASAVEDAEGGLPLDTAADLIKKTARAKFDESVDIDIRLGVDPRHADQMVRGSVALPHGTGKDVRVLVLTNEGQQGDARDAGADLVGLDDFVDKIQNDGFTDFDVMIATPDVMPKIGRLGRVLGPRGLMPNPKSGTVTTDVAAAVKAVKSGQIDFRVDKTGIVHTSIGKSSFSTEQIHENALAFIKEIVRLRPAAAKGAYVKSVTLSTTMGPAVPVDRSVGASAAR